MVQRLRPRRAGSSACGGVAVRAKSENRPRLAPFWLGVEIDGHGYHSTRSERAYDAERDNELSLVGWNMLHFTTDQVFKQPGLVGNTIWRALQTAKLKADVPPPSCDGSPPLR